MSFFPGEDPAAGDAAASAAIEQIVVPRSSDIGGFSVRRALPTAKRRLVGPFIFFDRMGPALLKAGAALDVRPHPHIGLSTVTYLFDGEITHRDSLGTEMVIRPGDVNLMTAGRGIVHSERSPEKTRGFTRGLSGLQTWLALPDGLEEIDPSFRHEAASTLPLFDADGASGRVVIGHYEGLTAPVSGFSETVYVDLTLAPGAKAPFSSLFEERALYVLDGTVMIDGAEHGPDQLIVLKPGAAMTLMGGTMGAHLMLFGGAAMNSPRYIWWNFVSSSKERLEQAKQEWATGRFDIVPGDEDEFIPLPQA
ncbi:hypothetical protein BJF93_17830 [Xaviernesmea oryzae]|uniref:Pirin n=1 Tax=Xaviernesmea oryzae TaxID=464029 RepID=A0A1Q9ATD1_9HYPH|nr:pirin family protein [Xaviernesmea oryzae]OLP58687.1 hypothetical protein BJF93_17830 [Xaviernesmea oryzae]SEK67904.1 hypothetical protein SAMN04487976_103274 [Xaviernesmea oryzae]